MVVLRATKKVLQRLPPITADDTSSDTALGDWYVNRIVVDSQPLLLMVSSLSLLAIITPARDVKHLPDRLSTVVVDRLLRLGIAPNLCQAEAEAMNPVQVGPTRDRSVLGSMVDFAKTIPYHLPVDAWDEINIRGVERRLAETPCRLAVNFEDTIFPEDMAPRLLKAKWG
ncbi:MAG: hypothetical protein OEZ54_04530 [Gemmatimonadota bacterium]|nr:hypothetical protein [Gemmatimonadota bacterium]